MIEVGRRDKIMKKRRKELDRKILRERESSEK